MGKRVFHSFLLYKRKQSKTLKIKSDEGDNVKDFKHDLGLRLIKLLNVILMVVPFGACWYLFYSEGVSYYRMGHYAVIAVFLFLYVLFARIYDAFLVSINRISEMVYSQGLAILLSDAIMFVIIWLLRRHFPSLWPGLVTLVIQLVLATIWSTLAHQWYYKSFPPKKSAIIYDRRYGIEGLIQDYGLQKKFDVVYAAAAEECVKDLSKLQDMNTVFVSGVNSHERNVILKYCVANDIDVYVIPRIGDIIMSGARKMHMFHLPVLRVGRCNPRPEEKLIKRLFDIVSSALVLLAISPIMIVTAIAIKTHDGGPVFYKQDRLTKDGKIFKVMKFRSMRVDAEKDGVARLSTGDKDDRITPVGRVIRKLRIDELPQLLNILGGSMSVVGPRPERPEIAAQYEEELPEFKLRLQVKAGLTGYAQVYGKYNTTPYDKLQMDLMYIANPSFVEDLRIIFATIKILFVPESTDGIAEGQTTAMADTEAEEKELQNV